MKKVKCLLVAFASAVMLLSPTILTAQSPEEFRLRRQMVTKMLPANSVLVLRSNEAAAGFDNPKIGGFFYYLTGINETDACLVLRGENTNPLPRARYGRRSQVPSAEILFITPLDPVRADWDAQGLGIEGATGKMGFTNVMPFREFDSWLGQLLLGSPSVLYMDIERSQSLDAPFTKDEQLLKMAREKGAIITTQSPAVLLSGMTHIKSPSEIEIMRKAVDITAEAHRSAMRSIQPGMYEYQLDGLIRYIFHINGSPSTGFPCIIGSGPNSVILHWMENSRLMTDGDIVVVDIGADYGMYWADITRTIPVNGKYSPRQKEIYDIVLKANHEAIRMVAPGVAFADISRKIDEILAAGMVETGLIKDPVDFRKYYFHGPGHHIGLINMPGGEIDTLKTGMVITIEPGIYVREEALGVRVEDDVLVTENGYEVLSKNVPKTIPEIEQIMKEEGIDYRKHLVKE